MKIAKNTVVTVEYQLSDAQNNLIEEGIEPMVYLHGGYENTLPKIEEALEGKQIGFETLLQVEPEDGFGDYDASLVKMEERINLPSPLEVGMQFEGTPEDSDEEEEDSIIYTVTEIVEDKVILDGNHPLAGIALRFTLKVLDVRAATAQEISNGFVQSGDEDDGDDDSDESGEYHTVHLH
jgi:FKBP-type peptidyl-prolyl cis-trans isomerase SlyD